MACKKDFILETTIKHIAIFGGSFSTERIAGDVGCSQSLIFRYYHNKEELMRMCFDSICHDILEVLKKHFLSIGGNS
jgi:AcrR family transcriptional regulator